MPNKKQLLNDEAIRNDKIFNLILNVDKKKMRHRSEANYVNGTLMTVLTQLHSTT